MAAQLLRIDENNNLGFGDYTLKTKTKVEDFEFQGDLYKVKTFAEITKLEKNGMFSYESVPGTSVTEYKVIDTGMSFKVAGYTDVQVTVELEPKQEYKVVVEEVEIGTMATNLSGKLSVSIELNISKEVSVVIEKL